MADIKDLAKDANEQGANQARTAVASVAATTREALSDVRTYAQPRLNDAQAELRNLAEQAQQGFRYVEKVVRSNPGPSVAAVLGVGIAFGVLIGLSMAPRRY